MHVDPVHSLHRVAATVHLDHLAETCVVKPGGVRVPVVVRLEFADQVRPGPGGHVGGLLLPVAAADRDSGPGFGGDVHGLADALAEGVEAFGGGG
jgi:hypothetical protein